MTKETMRATARVFLVLTILSFVMSCGSCAACATGETKYGPEEYYQKPGGGVGYGSLRQPNASDRFFDATFFLGLLMTMVFGSTSMLLKGWSLRPEKVEVPIRTKRLLNLPENPLNPLPGRSDPLFGEAFTIVVDHGSASTSLLQRHLRIGYGRAAAILDAMVREGYIGEMDGSTRAHAILTKAYEDLQDISEGALGDEQ